MNRMQCQEFYEKLRRLLLPFPRVALLSADHETIFLNYQTLADIGTLPQSAETSHKYLHIQDGDIVLTNDPFSGGTLLSSPTLIMGIGTRTIKGATPAEFLLACRLTLRPNIGPFKTVDEEGLRIPPSPFYLRGQLNSAIVEALRSHPQTPRDFIDRVNTEAEALLKLRAKLKDQLERKNLDLSKPTVKSYFQWTSRSFRKRLEEMGEGSGAIEVDITPSETVKLRVENHDGHFQFDFTGTSRGESLFLTDSATFGVAIGATCSLLHDCVPMNSGIFSHFDVKAPRGSLVNASFPHPLYLGHTDGVNILANAVVRCLSRMNRKHVWATSGSTHCSYQIQFRDGRIFTDTLPIGVGATDSGPGISAAYLWRRANRPPSIENWEGRFPIQILSTGFRSNSGGEGKYRGGMGASRSLVVLEEADLRWAFATPLHQPEGLGGGKSALGPQIILQKSNGEKEELAKSGQKKLSKGDTLIVLSPGGGGYGS